jgi:hypothetical protein
MAPQGRVDSNGYVGRLDETGEGRLGPDRRLLFALERYGLASLAFGGRCVSIEPK